MKRVTSFKKLLDKGASYETRRKYNVALKTPTGLNAPLFGFTVQALCFFCPIIHICSFFPALTFYSLTSYLG